MPTVKVSICNDEGEVHEVELPATYEVCERCRGEGTHVNPSIDGNGLSREDFDEDPDFEEDYFNGVYDVTCEECGGKRVVPQIDEDACKRKGLMSTVEAHYEQLREKYAHERECEAERRMGA